ncbi:MAG TPA: MFS transporter [Cyclobacteriaceae bacterium]|nr:MFS transporter [Cyclobacteriaceae bacterium]
MIAQALPDSAQKNLRLVILASAGGTLIEWYDLFMALILANTLSIQLFPPGDSKFLETVAIIVSSYFIRPIGSLLFGSIGDRVGRKYSFLITLMLMGGATFLIGCIPGYKLIGWGAPVLLLIFRLMQGLAISGEYAGAAIYVAEHAPQNKRGFYTGFIQATAPLALLFSLGVVYIIRSRMDDQQFNSFGWRIPFLFSIVLFFFSYLIRIKLSESPLYLELKRKGETSKTPIRECFRSKETLLLMLKAIFGGNAAQSAAMHTSQFVTLFFLQRSVRIPDVTALLILSIGFLFGGFFYQWAGALSDRVGRKKVILTGLVLSLIFIPFSFYWFMALGNPQRLTEVHAISNEIIFIFILLQISMMISTAMLYGPMGAFMLELFPTKIRYTGMGFAHNIGNGVIGGATPLVTEWIRSSFVIGIFMAPFAGLIYPLVLIVIGIIVNSLTVPETYERNLNE